MIKTLKNNIIIFKEKFIMKEFNFENTSIAANYSIELHDNFNFMWVESRTADMYRIFFSTIADVLKLRAIRRLHLSIRILRVNLSLEQLLNSLSRMKMRRIRVTGSSRLHLMKMILRMLIRRLIIIPISLLHAVTMKLNLFFMVDS